MAVDSSQPGYLPFIPAEPTFGVGGQQGNEYGAKLTRIYQQMVAELGGLPGAVVLPRWQQQTDSKSIPVTPPIGTNWASVAVNTLTNDAGPQIIHDPVAQQDIADRHQMVDVTVIFYGPDAAAIAEQVVHSIALPQNNEALKQYEMTFVSASPTRIVPEMLSEQWQLRADVDFRFRRRVSRYASIRNIVSGSYTITAVDPLFSETTDVVSD